MEERIKELRRELSDVEIEMENTIRAYQEYANQYNEKCQALHDRYVALSAIIEELESMVKSE